MTSRDFCYWLQGYFELSDGGRFTAEQSETVKRHLAMVFVHEIDPSFPSEQQSTLDKVHAVVKELTEDAAKPPAVPPHSHGYVPPPVYRC